MSDPAPLIVTLALDAVAQARLDALRQAHFPPERNHLAAHVTLFHALPGHRLDEVRADLSRAAAGQAPFEVRVVAPRSLGRGVALDLDAADLGPLRSGLARRWSDDLTRQDAGWSRPHVTVQNKVTPDAARALLAELADGFEPWTATAEGLGLWWYRGGPWDHVRTFAFARPDAPTDDPPSRPGHDRRA